MSGGGYGVYADEEVEILCDHASKWITYLTDWQSNGLGMSGLWYRRYGAVNQLSGEIIYKGAAQASVARAINGVVDFSQLGDMKAPRSNASYDGEMMGSTGIAMRAILLPDKTMRLYRPLNATWSLATNDVFPIALTWLSPMIKS